MSERISLEAIEALENLGIGAEVNLIAELVAGHGMKHGWDGWKRLSYQQIQKHISGHVGPVLTIVSPLDVDSGMHPAAHLAVRSLQLLHKVREEERALEESLGGATA